MPLLSIIVPVHNERENLSHFHAELSAVLSQLPYDFEILMIDDGSSDGSQEILAELGKKDPRIQVIGFSRNFGKEQATSAGLREARGIAAILIDADLQHPPALIAEFIRHWEHGADTVIGLRQENAGEGWVKKWGSKIFYRVISIMAETDIRPRSTDYCLISRTVIDAFNGFRERNRMTRALISWLDFKKAYVPFHADARHAGSASYNLSKLASLFVSTLIAHSRLPLRAAGILGVVIMILDGILGVFVGITKFFMGNPFGFTGSSALAVVVVFLAGIIVFFLGIIALYIANIHDQVMGRPLYVVRNSPSHRE